MADAEHDPRLVVCVDLDGVLNTFDEWRGAEYFHPPREGARAFLEHLHTAGYRVVILTVRWHEWVTGWLTQHDLSRFVDEVTDRKPPAHVYLDDRAVCFKGDFDEALERIAGFRPFWETPLVEAKP